MNKKSLVGLAFLLIMVVSLVFVMNSTTAQDYLRSFGYTPTAEVTEIENKIGLTNKAKGIFRAARPVLESRDNFNYHCASHDEQVSVLGCYANSKIYAYNVDTAVIEGVKESTMAHELLHAIWERMTSAEKEAITDDLWAIYDSNQDLAEDLDIYEEKDKLDELHSRVGTQIVDTKLSEELRAHYAQYFDNQSKIVEYYVNYNEPFKQLEIEAKSLKSEIETLNDTIAQKTAEYETRVMSLSGQINEFNGCANKIGCFSNEAEFYAKRNTLIAEQDALEGLYQELNNLVVQQNAKVSEYNKNVLRTQDLQNSINSNSAPPTV